MYSIFKDIQFAFKLMRKSPAMTWLVIAALVLGIGLNTAVFSVVNAVLLRSIPVDQADRVFNLYAKMNPAGTSLGISYPEYQDWKRESRSFQSLIVIRILSFNLTGHGVSEHVKAYGVSGSLADTVSLQTTLGRQFNDADDRRDAEPVVILSHAFWQRKFGGANNILGTLLTLDDKAYMIIGVLQPTEIPSLQPDVWLPNGLFLDDTMMNRESRFYWPQARLKPGVTREAAEAEMQMIAARLAAQYPASNKNVGIRFEGLVDWLIGKSTHPLSFLFLASTLIFMLACANILLVFVAMVGERRQELSVRFALGASRSSLLPQFLIQSLMFIFVGVALALLVAKIILRVFLHRFPATMPRFHEASIDTTVIAFVVVLAIIFTFIASFLPMAYALRISANTALNGKPKVYLLTRHRSAAQATLVAFEVSLATALSLVAGLLIKSFYEVAKVDLGFKPRQILSFQLNLPESRYGKSSERSTFFGLALAKISSSPGLASTSAISALPLTNQGGVINLQADSSSPVVNERSLVEDEAVLPRFFQTLNVPLLQGRDFSETDQETSQPVVIIDDFLAEQFWPGQSPIGKHLRLAYLTDPTSPWREVIGVVKRMRHFGPEKEVRWPRAYVPYYQDPRHALSFVINTNLSESTVRAMAESAIQQLDPDLPLDSFRSLDDLLDNYTAPRKLSLLLLSCFAGVGLILGGIGIYGMISYSVAQRRRDIAIRLALGASRRQAMLVVVQPALVGAFAGMLVAGLAIAGLARLLAVFLFGITALDPAVYALTAVVIAVVAVLAAILPARAVLKLDPQQVLRET